MGVRRAKWQLITGFTVATCLVLVAGAAAQFSSYNSHNRAILEGNWQSCKEADGKYGERVYDGKLPGLGPFELHMGPYHEFALFRGVQDEHREHQSAGNLLRPYEVKMQGMRAKQVWDVVGLRLDVVLAGGAEECESWYVTLTPTRSAS